jgi:two-component system, OmpR family, phosphate regulon sensor histidine kinase PhoR
MSDAQLLNLLLHNMQDGVVMFDHDAMITRVNPAAEKLLGLSAAELVGKPASALPSPYNERFAAWWLQLIPTIIDKPLEYEEYFSVHLTLSLYKRGAIMLIGMPHRFLSDFMGLGAGEIKQPLASLQNIADVLLSDQSKSQMMSEQQMQFPEVVREKVRQTLYIVESLCDLAAIYSGRFIVHLSSIDLETVVEAATAQIKDTLTKRQQTLTIDLPFNLPKMRGDRFRLRQVLVNLLKNASVYSPPHTTITLTAHHSNRFVQVAVRDQGIGLTIEVFHLVFRKGFYRGGIKEVREVPGLGASLYITRHIIKAHGGNIWAEGALDQGATFYFTVPIAEGQE